MLLIELIKLLPIIIASAVALYGINAWRREHIGKRRLELAEDTLAMFYEARDAISHIRAVWGMSIEADNLVREDKETDDQFEARKRAAVTIFLYKEHQELFSKIHATRYRFMAQIGIPEADPFEKLRLIENEILLGARALARRWSRTNFGTKRDWEKHLAQIDKYEAIIWEERIEEDPITPRINEIIADIEKTCQAIIAGKGSRLFT